jgi:hypothetical protein
MAAVKCTIGREKDRVQLGYLIEAGILDTETIRDRLGEITMQEKLIVKSRQFLDDLSSDGSSKSH